MEAVDVPTAHRDALLASVDADVPHGRIVIIDDRSVDERSVDERSVDARSVIVLPVDDAFDTDLVRHGDVPSLGPVLELAQMTARHLVVTVEGGVFGLTDFSFGDVSTLDQHTLDQEASATSEVVGSFEGLAQRVRSIAPTLIALIGAADEVQAATDQLVEHTSAFRIVTHPTDDIDRDLFTLADRVVQDAASVAAELRTNHLSHFRQARTVDQVVEGPDVLAEIEAQNVRRVLVHDTANDGSSDTTRLADLVVAEAVRWNVPVTMIPTVPADRGPRGGIGAILLGDVIPVPLDSLPMELPGNRLRRPRPRRDPSSDLRLTGTAS